MRYLYWLLLVLFATDLHGQLAYEGVVTDDATAGKFILEFRPSEVERRDIIRISSLGYLSREIPVTLLKEDVLKLMIRLKPEPLSLDEVILTDKEYVEVEEEVGYRNLLGQGRSSCSTLSRFSLMQVNGYSCGVRADPENQHYLA